MPACADDHAQGRGSFSFSMPGEHDHKADPFVRFKSRDCNLRVQSSQFAVVIGHRIFSLVRHAFIAEAQTDGATNQNFFDTDGHGWTRIEEGELRDSHFIVLCSRMFGACRSVFIRIRRAFIDPFWNR
ncbi:hypothetical protein SBDP1_520014 [Syntrophobacter sp. SbD1]|nr:hypothetical protein SBDP1_520014 [Syntrophobacter sp. SbD1]